MYSFVQYQMPDWEAETSISEMALLSSNLIQCDVWRPLFRVGGTTLFPVLALTPFHSIRDQRANHSAVTITHQFIQVITLQMVRVKDL